MAYRILMRLSILIAGLLGVPAVQGADPLRPIIRQVTRVSQDEAAFSPDGTRIAFISDADGPANIFVMDSSGRHVVRLTAHATHDNGPVWSPSGRTIAFSSTDPVSHVSEIYLMNADGSELRMLTHDRAFAIHPSWSPEGRRLMYTTTRESQIPTFDKADVWQTWIIDANGTNARRLPVEGPVNTYASWSPDGRKILLRRKESSKSNISDVFVMDADGTHLTRLTGHAAYERFPSWSPDGKQIVFESNRSGHSQLMIMSADGSNLRILVDGPGNLSAPRFSPDGKLVLYPREYEGEFKLFTVVVPGSPADSR